MQPTNQNIQFQRGDRMELVATKDKQDLERLEAEIREDIGFFVRVGRNLTEIRDRKLYDKVRGVATFESYCQKEFGFARQTAYQFIDAVKVIDNVRNCGQNITLPATESQARPLTKLKDEPEKQREAWSEAVATAPEGKVTAAHVAKVVKAMTEPPKPPPKKKNEPIIKPLLVSDEFQAAFDNMVVEIKNARAMKWQRTSHKAAIELMQTLLNIAEL
jgi:hypothetical protein